MMRICAFSILRNFIDLILNVLHLKLVSCRGMSLVVSKSFEVEHLMHQHSDKCSHILFYEVLLVTRWLKFMKVAILNANYSVWPIG